MSSPAADPALYIMRCQRLRERLLPPRGTLHPAKFERIYGAALAEISSFSISSARIWYSSACLRRLTFKTGSVLSRARRRHLSACSLKYDWSIAHHRWLPWRGGDGTSMLFRVPKFRVRKANGPQARGKLMPNQFGVTVYHCSVARNDKAQPVC